MTKPGARELGQERRRPAGIADDQQPGEPRLRGRRPGLGDDALALGGGAGEAAQKADQVAARELAAPRAPRRTRRRAASGGATRRPRSARAVESAQLEVGADPRHLGRRAAPRATHAAARERRAHRAARRERVGDRGRDLRRAAARPRGGSGGAARPRPSRPRRARPAASTARRARPGERKRDQEQRRRPTSGEPAALGLGRRVALAPGAAQRLDGRARASARPRGVAASASRAATAAEAAGGSGGGHRISTGAPSCRALASPPDLADADGAGDAAPPRQPATTAANRRPSRSRWTTRSMPAGELVADRRVRQADRRPSAPASRAAAGRPRASSRGRSRARRRAPC